MQQVPLIIGIHHITALCGDIHSNLCFYSGILGLRLVEISVNQDDPTVYHLFYGDNEGSPGTVITFFPLPNLPPARKRSGRITEIAFSIPQNSLDFWRSRLPRFGTKYEDYSNPFGEKGLLLHDPDGLTITLIPSPPLCSFSPWSESPVPPEHQIQGFYCVTLWEKSIDQTAMVLSRILEYTLLENRTNSYRFTPESRTGKHYIDVVIHPDQRKGLDGKGGIHHCAWATRDRSSLEVLFQKVKDLGLPSSGIVHRYWFHSLYFREPGGALFEISTIEPGFTAKASPDNRSYRVTLPPWLESQRTAIEQQLPPLPPFNPQDWR